MNLRAILAITWPWFLLAFTLCAAVDLAIQALTK